MTFDKKFLYMIISYLLGWVYIAAVSITPWQNHKNLVWFSPEIFHFFSIFTASSKVSLIPDFFLNRDSEFTLITTGMEFLFWVGVKYHICAYLSNDSSMSSKSSLHLTVNFFCPTNDSTIPWKPNNFSYEGWLTYSSPGYRRYPFFGLASSGFLSSLPLRKVSPSSEQEPELGSSYGSSSQHSLIYSITGFVSSFSGSMFSSKERSGFSYPCPYFSSFTWISLSSLLFFIIFFSMLNIGFE